MKATDLINNALKSSISMPSDKALAELKKLLDHNDAQANRLLRVPASAACELLTSHGFPCQRLKLDRVCRAAFGRKTYSSK